MCMHLWKSLLMCDCVRVCMCMCHCASGMAYVQCVRIAGVGRMTPCKGQPRGRSCGCVFTFSVRASMRCGTSVFTNMNYDPARMSPSPFPIKFPHDPSLPLCLPARVSTRFCQRTLTNPAKFHSHMERCVWIQRLMKCTINIQSERGGEPCLKKPLNKPDRHHGRRAELELNLEKFLIPSTCCKWYK